ncbi:MAG: phosphoribosylanthranilate isomerase [Actinomycetota bacterium]|nr:phosphoribosylanthranilate isomerase [Actinomycetota bacterium]
MFVKICGITSEEDALLAVAMGADAIGFVFAPSSRQVTPAVVSHITRRLPSEVITVGVFRNSLPERVVEVVQQAGLRAAQLHGSERPEQCAYVAERVPLVIKAFAAGEPALFDHARYRADVVMIDGAEPGSGQLFDWRLAEGLPPARRVLLAGGLNADNVADAIRTLRPWGVDVSSGVERAPGLKDPTKVRAFIQAARAALPSEPDALEGGGPYDWQEELGW